MSIQYALIGRGEIIEAKVVTKADGANTADPESGNSIFGNRFANRIWVGVVGDASIQTGTCPATDIVFRNLAAGVWHRMPPFKNVNSTGTEGTEFLVGIASNV